MAAIVNLPVTRQQRYRARKTAGVILLTASIPAHAAARMVELGWVKPGAPPDDIRGAVAEIFNRALKRGMRPGP